MVQAPSIDKSLYNLFAPKRAPQVKQGFEQIYAQFRQAPAPDAKGFLQSLSNSQMQTIQKFHSLADSINVDSLSKEGAANLLQKPYEKLDLNGDGMYEVGAATTGSIVPHDADEEFKTALYEGLKELKDTQGNKEAFSVMGMLSFAFNRDALNNHIEDANIASFDMSYEGVRDYVASRNNPGPGEYTDPKILEGLNTFFESFSAAYGKSGSEATTTQVQAVSDESSSATKAMLQKLLDKGALNFIQDLNADKIEKLIEQKRAELEAKYQNSNVNDPKIASMIAEELSNFKKELMEKLSDKSELDSRSSQAQIQAQNERKNPYMSYV